MSLSTYAEYLRGEARLSAFRRAILAAVRPGDRVLDLGTGLGSYALFALEGGAGEVWGVDREPIVHTAASLARWNRPGTGTFHAVQGQVPGVDLPGEVDLLLFEDFAAALLDTNTFRMLRTVQQAQLRPGAQMIVSTAQLALAPAGGGGLREHIFPLDRSGDRAHGIDWAPLRELLANHPRQVRLRPTQLLGEPMMGPKLSLLPLPMPEALALESTWSAEASMEVEGIALWFDLSPGGEEWLSNAPGPNAEPWGQLLLPLDPPLHLPAGAILTLRVQRERLEDGAPGWIVWSAEGGGEQRSGHEFSGVLASPRELLPPPSGRGGAPLPL